MSFLEFAVEACRKAGEVTLQYFQTDLAIETKADRSPVTVADRRSEETIREWIGRYYPSHAIIGEEYRGPEISCEYRCFIDPIDGTVAFVRGVPIYGVMLGLEYRGEFIVGVVHLPALKEMIYASRDEGCFFNDRRARVSDTASLSDAWMCHSGREYFAQFERIDAYEKLQSITSRQRTWGDCYGHILVATGRADLCVDPVLNPWDAAALIPIVQEAGGTFTDWNGSTTAFGGNGMSTNGKLLPELLAITAPQP